MKIYAKDQEFKEFAIMANVDANMGRAFVLHIILVYDIEFENILKKISANNYFKNIESILQENPHAMVVYAFDIIPGKSYPLIRVYYDQERTLMNCIVLCNFKQSAELIPRKIVVGNLKKSTLWMDGEGLKLLVDNPESIPQDVIDFKISQGVTVLKQKYGKTDKSQAISNTLNNSASNTIENLGNHAEKTITKQFDANVKSVKKSIIK